ncbi:MAG: TraR/DksA family transcriptional regulator [Victivallaceae bacterium]|nr:TraR/DksA family transcriptional regulator [Victivallaceae bacterium]
MTASIDRSKLSKEDLYHYDMLLSARDAVHKRMEYHASDALDAENLEKRGVNTHMADVSGDNSRHEMDLRLLTEDGDVIQLIEDAIDRLANGEYGRCCDCGEKISKGRLDARPYALYCIKCKSIREQNGGINPKFH